MIKEEDYNNRENILKDKQDFIYYAVMKKGFAHTDVLNFMEHYQNLISFDENIKDLKEFLK